MSANTSRPDRETAKIMLIGVGNDFRQDDGVGLVVLRKLQNQIPPRIKTLETSVAGLGLIEAWQGAEIVYLFDAVLSGAKIATIHRLDARVETIPVKFLNFSTHSFSISEVIKLARILDLLPPELIIYGIEGKNFAPGIGLSLEVEQIVEELVQRVLLELKPHFQ